MILQLASSNYKVYKFVTSFTTTGQVVVYKMISSNLKHSKLRVGLFDVHRQRVPIYPEGSFEGADNPLLIAQVVGHLFTLPSHEIERMEKIGERGEVRCSL